MDTRERTIEELKQLFGQRFLRHCDNSITWHLICVHLAKAVVLMMRFMAYGANYQGNPESQTKKDVLFSLFLQVCSSQNIAYTMKETQGFMWHVNIHFQWKAFVCVLSELRYRTSGPEVEQAWKDAQLTYEFHSTFDKELYTRALPIAISNLALEVLKAYIGTNDTPNDGEPYFIQLIRNQQNRPEKINNFTRQSRSLSTDLTPSSAPDYLQESAANDEAGVNRSATHDWSVADLDASLDVLPDLAPIDHPKHMDQSA